MKFQIPEGTFGTGWGRSREAYHPRFKSRKERLGRDPGLRRGPVPGRGFKSRKERLGPRREKKIIGLCNRVSNPGRNVWDPGPSAESWRRVVFQIPEGTFGTRHRGGTSSPVGGVSNPGRNVWDFLFVFYMLAPCICFKSRKERLGLEKVAVNLVDQREFQIPEGTFGTVGWLEEMPDLKMFQIPEGTFGTRSAKNLFAPEYKVSNPGRNVWDRARDPGRKGALRGFKSRKERLGRRGGGDGR